MAVNSMWTRGAARERHVCAACRRRRERDGHDAGIRLPERPPGVERGQERVEKH